MAKKDKAKKVKKPGWVSQLTASYRMTKETDRRIGPVLLGVFLASGIVTFALLLLLPGHWALDLVGAVLVGILVVLIVFGRRAERAAFARIEGQPGAAAAALGMLRRGWQMDTAIAFNRQQDVVHRVVGRPGIILVGEGNPNRLRNLLANERRKHERVASEAPIHEVVVGDGEGEVPIRKLVKHVRKMKRQLKPAEVTDVLARLRALDANRPSIPLPKGPIPTSLKGARQNLRGR